MTRRDIRLGQVIRDLNAQVGATYTPDLTDVGKLITMDNASASTFVVPLHSAVPFLVGTSLEGIQIGAGQVTLTATGGVTLLATPGLKVAAQYGTFGLVQVVVDTWVAYGRLVA